jgi:hypothetical protein
MDARRLVPADSARYAPPGYLLFVQQATLLAQSFDPKKLELSGEPIRVAESIPSYLSAPAFSGSDNGILAYRSGFQTIFCSWRSSIGLENCSTKSELPPLMQASICLRMDGGSLCIATREPAVTCGSPTRPVAR